MAFIQPRSTERDNQNALRKFPFADNAACGNDACVIVPGAIVDAVLYVPGRDPGTVWMSAVDTNGILHFSDAGGDFAETTAPVTPETAVPVVFTGTGGPLPGGIVVFGREEDVRVLRSAGGQSFTADQTELAPSAVTWLNLAGVSGFLLDDGHVVSGHVKIRGANGCDVATYVRNRVNYLRISAIGKTVDTVTTTGFITKVVAESDYTNFTVSKADKSDHVIEILANGVTTVEDGDLNADQEDLCDKARKSSGTLPSKSATIGPDCTAGLCRTTQVSTEDRVITLMTGTGTDDTVVPDTGASGHLKIKDGNALGTLLAKYIPSKAGKRFRGYFDASKKLYYRYDGKGVGTFDAGANVTLYAYWVTETDPVEITFQDYGTLHLSAPDVDLPKYTNPIIISGCQNPVPTVSEISDDALEKGGADALSDIVLHPTVPNGEVHIGIRGLEKTYSL